MKEIKKLYVISVFSAKKKTDKDYEKEAKINSVKLNREVKPEEMKKKFAFSKADHYKFAIDENIAYFDNFKEADEFIRKNTCDVHEWVFNYGAILELPMNRAYPEIHSTNLYIYEYNKDNGEYGRLSREEIEDELYSAISDQFGYNEELAKINREMEG